MDEETIEVGLIGAASVLYGLYLVYYTSAHSQQYQERMRIYDRAEKGLMQDSDRRAGLTKLEERRGNVDILILGATLVFVPTVLIGLLWFLCRCLALIVASGIGFAGLVAIAAPLATLGPFKDLQDARKELRTLLEEEKKASSAKSHDDRDDGNAPPSPPVYPNR